jgi:hypothetical protein
LKNEYKPPSLLILITNNLGGQKMKMAIFVVLSAIMLSGIVAAIPPEKTEGFVCPVFTQEAVTHNPNVFEIGEGHWSLLPGSNPEDGPRHIVKVPKHATNGDGAGVVGGEHSEPGDSDYTAIWDTEAQ